MGLSGRNAVVTGAASGIGLAISQRLARDGASVAVLDINLEAAERLAKQLSTDGANAVAIQVDVTNRPQVDQAVETVHTALGPVHILVTSAGLPRSEPFLEISQESWDYIIAVNLTGTFNCVQATIGDMVSAGWGRIVNISSSGAQSGAPQMEHYAAAKAGVIGLTKSLANEFGPAGITVNVIPPGQINTPLFKTFLSAGDASGIPSMEEMGASLPVGRLGEAEDVAAACAFLVSEEAGYITGQTLGVNGGRVMP